jgi:hypothetical protein
MFGDLKTGSASSRSQNMLARKHGENASENAKKIFACGAP